MTNLARSSSPLSVRERAGRLVPASARRPLLNTLSVLPAVGFHGPDVAGQVVNTILDAVAAARGHGVAIAVAVAASAARGRTVFAEVEFKLRFRPLLHAQQSAAWSPANHGKPKREYGNV